MWNGILLNCSSSYFKLKIGWMINWLVGSTSSGAYQNYCFICIFRIGIPMCQCQYQCAYITFGCWHKMSAIFGGSLPLFNNKYQHFTNPLIDIWQRFFVFTESPSSNSNFCRTQEPRGTKKITQSLGTKKNDPTSPGKKNKKNLLGQKKITQ